MSNTKNFIKEVGFNYNLGNAVKLIAEPGETASEKAKSYQEAIEYLTEEFNAVATEAEQAAVEEKRAKWREAYKSKQKAKKTTAAKEKKAASIKKSVPASRKAVKNLAEEPEIEEETRELPDSEE